MGYKSYIHTKILYMYKYLKPLLATIFSKIYDAIHKIFKAKTPALLIN